jgi:biotin transporter BioY
VSTFHEIVGYGVVTVFGLLWLWPASAWVLGKIRRVHGEPGSWYWNLVAIVQIILAIQIVLGLTLLALRGIDAQPLLHYFYGSLFPIIVLVAAHMFARGMERDQWVPFAWGGFICWGLVLRALFTGLGIG